MLTLITCGAVICRTDEATLLVVCPVEPYLRFCVRSPSEVSGFIINNILLFPLFWIVVALSLVISSIHV